MPATTAEHAEMLANRVRKNAKPRRKWAARVPTDAYRLYDHDIPEVPVVIDRYGDHLHAADARYESRIEGHDDDWFDVVVDAAAAMLSIPAERVHRKRRERQRGMEQYEKLGREGTALTVEEYGLKFRVNLDDYLDTGLFLDHRSLRREVGQASEGKTVLNLFAYTGSFTVHAAAGGARGTTTVDLSTTYLDWAEENLRINELLSPRHERVRSDTYQFLRDARSSGRTWDIVVVDPPTFSNSKRMRGTFDVQRDHAAMLGMIAALTSPDGEIRFSTNRRKFKLDPSSLPPDCTFRETTDETVPADFSQRRPHRSYSIVRNSAS